jgi:hypothetical protein
VKIPDPTMATVVRCDLITKVAMDSAAIKRRACNHGLISFPFLSLSHSFLFRSRSQVDDPFDAHPNTCSILHLTRTLVNRFVMFFRSPALAVLASLVLSQVAAGPMPMHKALQQREPEPSQVISIYERTVSEAEAAMSPDGNIDPYHNKRAVVQEADAAEALDGNIVAYKKRAIERDVQEDKPKVLCETQTGTKQEKPSTIMLDQPTKSVIPPTQTVTVTRAVTPPTHTVTVTPAAIPPHTATVNPAVTPPPSAQAVVLPTFLPHLPFIP